MVLLIMLLVYCTGCVVYYLGSLWYFKTQCANKEIWITHWCYADELDSILHNGFRPPRSEKCIYDVSEHLLGQQGKDSVSFVIGLDGPVKRLKEFLEPERPIAQLSIKVPLACCDVFYSKIFASNLITRKEFGEIVECVVPRATVNHRLNTVMVGGAPTAKLNRWEIYALNNISIWRRSLSRMRFTKGSRKTA